MFAPEIDDRPPRSYMPCTNCRGKKVDPKKRTRKCPTCRGSGLSNRCGKCNKPVRPVIGIVEEGKDYCTCYMIPRSEWEATI